jgi:hypothetical protein
VEFDPSTYRAWQEGARLDPWWAALDRRVVVFDTPYVDLRRAPETQGIVAWGAHDPGTSLAGRPEGVLAEFERRFGRYPAAPWTYGIPWPSPARTQAMGEALSHALDVRTRAARWLMTERLPDWDLFIAVAGEVHGAVEGLCGTASIPASASRPPVGAPAATALLDVHAAWTAWWASSRRPPGTQPSSRSRWAAWARTTPTAVHGPLAGLLSVTPSATRCSPCPGVGASAPGLLPILDEAENWEASRWVPRRPRRRPPTPGRALRLLARRLPTPVRAVLKGAQAGLEHWRSPDAPSAHGDLAWQPAAHYRRHWPRMSAFALPSFYDGRIRINLRGRERDGIVEPSRYEETCRALETLLRECRDPRTGRPAVADIERASTADPLALAGSESDLLVVWSGTAAALEHPRLGLIGPVALRRTGGHTGPHGMAYVATPGLAPGDRGSSLLLRRRPHRGGAAGQPAAGGTGGVSLLAERLARR